MDTTDSILMGKKRGLHLLIDRIVDKDGAEYFIRDMKSASVKESGSMKADGLLIEFKNGENKVFYVTSTSTPLWERVKTTAIASFIYGGRGTMMTTLRDLQREVAEWVVKINELIGEQKGTTHH